MPDVSSKLLAILPYLVEKSVSDTPAIPQLILALSLERRSIYKYMIFKGKNGGSGVI
jgi:hypothetical protein